MYKFGMKKASSMKTESLREKLLKLLRRDAEVQDSPGNIGVVAHELYQSGVYDAHKNCPVQAIDDGESKRALALAEWQKHNRPR